MVKDVKGTERIGSAVADVGAIIVKLRTDNSSSTRQFRKVVGGTVEGSVGSEGRGVLAVKKISIEAGND